jgi:hypothetical protein
MLAADLAVLVAVAGINCHWDHLPGARSVAPAIVGGWGLSRGWSGAWPSHSRRAHSGKRSAVSVVPLTGDPRSPRRRGSDEPHSRAVLPFMSAKRTLRRAGSVIAKKHRGRNARGAAGGASWASKTRPPTEAAYGRKAMEWFSRKTSIAGVQIPNWGIVLGAVIVILFIYSAVIH